MKQLKFALNLVVEIDETHPIGSQAYEKLSTLSKEELANVVVQFPALQKAFDDFNASGTWTWLRISDDQTQAQP